MVLHLQVFVSEHKAIETSRLRIVGRPFLLATWERNGEPPLHGEAAPLEGYGADDLSSAETALRAIQPDALEKVTCAVIAAFSDSKKALGNGGETPLSVVHEWSFEIPSPAARFCAETLVLSAAARACRVPLWRLLTSECVADTLRTSSVVDPLAADWSSDFERQYAQGIRTFKFKCGRDVSRERAAILRAAESSGVRIRIDPNGAFELPAAVEFLSDLPQEAIDWIEDPTKDVAEWDSLRRITKVPLAVDEPLARGLSFEEAEYASPDVVVLKPMALGGFTVSRKWAEWAKKNGASVCVSHLFDGNTAMNATIHLAFALQCPRYAAGLGLHPALECDPSGTPRATGLARDLLSCPTTSGDGS